MVFLPASDDPVNEASSEDQAHVTTVWFGEADLPWPLINEAVAAAAAAMKPFTVAVKSRGLLGDKDADVLFLDADDLAEQRQALLDVPVIKDGMDSVEQYPQWTPHLTLGYPDSPATLAEEPEAITIDRLALWVGNERTTYPLGADMADDDFEPTPTDDLIDVVEAVPFWGVLAPKALPREIVDSSARGHCGLDRSRCRCPISASTWRATTAPCASETSSAHGGRARSCSALDACSPPSPRSTKSSASWPSRAAGWACPSTPTTSKSR